MLGHSSHNFVKLDSLMPYCVLSRNVMSVVSCHAVSCRVVSCHLMLCRAVSCHIIYVIC